MQVAPANRRYLQAGALPWCTDCWVFLLINGRFGPVGSSETAVVATSIGHKGANPNKLQREAFLFGATPARRSNRVCGPLVVSVGLQLCPKKGHKEPTVAGGNRSAAIAGPVASHGQWDVGKGSTGSTALLGAGAHPEPRKPLRGSLLGVTLLRLSSATVRKSASRPPMRGCQNGGPLRNAFTVPAQF